MLPGASGKWRNCSSAPPGRHARMLSPVTATRRAPGRPRQHESGAHRGAISEGHRSMQPVCSVHFCSDAPPLLAWHRPLEGDQYDHDRAGVPRQRASMPVLGRVGERSGKQTRFLRPRRDLGSGCRPDREIDRRAGDQGNRRTFAPSGGRGLTVRNFGLSASFKPQSGAEANCCPVRTR